VRTTEDVLAHFGVKGMKWGVRQDPGHEGERVKTRHFGKLDKEWQNNVYNSHGVIALHNAVADRMNNGGLRELNNRPQYKNKKLLDPNTGEPVGALGRQYLRDHEKLTLKFMKESVPEVFGSSPSGNFKASWEIHQGNPYIKVSLVNLHGVKVKHANIGQDSELRIEFNFTENGIASARKVKDSVTQSSVRMTEEVLAHFGVRGMRWGVRRDGTSGQVSSDHKNARMLQRKGVAALNNQQLKTVNERLNLEQNFNRMNPSTRRKGESHVKEILATLTLATTAFATFRNTAGGKAMVKAGENAVRGIARKLNNKEAVALKVLSDRIVGG
jgi:hypothetical protein